MPAVLLYTGMEVMGDSKSEAVTMPRSHKYEDEDEEASLV